jgi:ribosomal-protein-alanine N-acetyltransferase
MRYITGGEPWTDQRIQEFVAAQQRLQEERGFCRWKLIDKATGELAGFCGMGFLHLAGEDPEIGWWLARRYWGQGLASEAARFALDDGFERVRLDRIVSIARPENRASTRIMEKLGLKFEREWTDRGLTLVKYAIDRESYLTAAPGRS